MTHSVARNQIVLIESIPPQGMTIILEADDNARAAIARRLGVPAVKRLLGVFGLTKTTDGVDVAGRIEAAVQRECVASLELFDEAVDEAFEIEFARGLAPAGEVEIDERSPEPLDGESLDLGELLIQQLSLSIEPYPRKPGARSLTEDLAPEQNVSPFSGLKAALAKKEDGE